MKRVLISNIINFLFLSWLEIVFQFSVFDEFLKESIINIFIYTIIVSIIVTLLTNVFTKKINKINLYIIYTILPILYAIQLVFKNIFNNFFSISLLGLSDQVMAFGTSTLLLILSNVFYIILFFIPLLLLIIFRKKIKLDRLDVKKIVVEGALLVSLILAFNIYLYIGKDEYLSGYSLMHDVNQTDLNIEKLGVLNAYRLDIIRTTFGFNEKIEEVFDNNENESQELFEYDYNTKDLNLDDVKKKSQIAFNYISKNTGTKQNKYTGIFEGKNLIYIVAESFNEIAISPELTPTLYKLTNSSFIFDNFYTPNYLSTIGGEFQALTGLHPSYELLTNWRKGNDYFPYGLANIYKKEGYKTFAYHNNSGYFQDRNKYLKSLGFDNFKACYMGLKINCNMWPQSDVEMINATVNDYINSDKPFMTYYMTVSGHFEYNFDNSMAIKHRNEVKNLPYSEEVKAYIATQIELDKALETLIKKLEEANKLDDTVIVLMADHYPYALSLNQINEASSYKKDGTFEINHNKLIIYNSKLKDTKITKVASSSDVLPTVYNLFGIDYDSRLFTGSDILSTKEGLVIFEDRSWISDKAIYNSSKNTYTSKDTEVNRDYIDNINALVNNKIAYSKEVINKNIYKYIKEN